MSNYYTYKPSIGSTGQYIASGRPWVKSATVSNGATETYRFPTVTRTISVFSNRDISLYFHSSAPAENKITLDAAGSPHTFNLKCRELFVDNDSGSPASVTIVAGITGIDEEYNLTGSGITEP
tara:strand:+ start:319 stop:687 length:369 start_codon:yes stop_codon:yes gene_type:complete